MTLQYQSSTGMNKEILGILVLYKVRIKLMVSYWEGGVSKGFQLVWAGVDRVSRFSGNI